MGLDSPWSAAANDFGIMQLNRGTSRTESEAMSISNRIGLGDTSRAESNESLRYAIGGGLDLSASMMETEEMLIDMNGDGLPDRVSKAGNYLMVLYNQGDRFSEKETLFIVAPWYITDAAKKQFAEETNGNLWISIFRQLPIVGDIVSRTTSPTWN